MIIRPIEQAQVNDGLRHEFHNEMLKAGFRHETGMIYTLAGVRVTLCEPFVFSNETYVEVNIAGKMFDEESYVCVEVRSSNFVAFAKRIAVAINLRAALKFDLTKTK